MSNLVYLNNKYIPFKDAKIPIEDRGFQFSDSVYEVVKIINKNILDFDFHMRRLKYSTSELNFNFKIKNELFKKIFQNLIKKNKLSNGIIYLQITRGVQSREHAYKKNLKPNLIVYTSRKKFNLPKSIRIASILRDNKIIIPNSSTIFKENDDVVFFAETNYINKLEKLLSTY